jgi:hypothetical protein
MHGEKCIRQPLLARQLYQTRTGAFSENSLAPLEPFVIESIQVAYEGFELGGDVSLVPYSRFGGGEGSA